MDPRYPYAGAGDLPWGWWLRARSGKVHDAEGRSWNSVREAFWEGRLGMPSQHFTDEQQTLLMKALGAVDASWLRSGESAHDLFGGDMMFWRFHMTWLASVGLLDLGLLVDGRRDSVLGCGLSAEGRAVTPMPHLFARERVGRTHLVTLTSIDMGDRMPVRRVAWSASFLDERHRDDLFGWLAERVHGWEAWGRLVRLRGAGELTSHLLSLLVASPIGGRPGRAPDDRG